MGVRRHRAFKSAVFGLSIFILAAGQWLTLDYEVLLRLVLVGNCATPTSTSTSTPTRATRQKDVSEHDRGRTILTFSKDDDTNITKVHAQNVCLETRGGRQVLWVWNMDVTSEINAKFGDIEPHFTSSRSLHVMDKHKLRTIQSPCGADVEWLDEEYYLVRRRTEKNIYHWMQMGYSIHSRFFDTDDRPKRIFHVPSKLPFERFADLSYLQFVSMLGVKEQRTVLGRVTDFSDKHADEILDDKRRYTCFANASLGQISPTNAFHHWDITGVQRQAYNAYLERIRSALSLPPPKIECPPKVTIVLRFLNSTNRARYIENFPQIETELQRRSIKYQYLDLTLEPDLKTFRQQIEFASSRSILVAAHGQGLWLAHFVPNDAAVIEITPFGFVHEGYRNIAADHGLHNYSILEVPQPAMPPDPGQVEKLTLALKARLKYNASAIKEVLNKLPSLLQPGDYGPVTEYLESLGLSTRAGPLAHIFSRDQPLWVNATELVDKIEGVYSYQIKHLCSDGGI